MALDSEFLCYDRKSPNAKFRLKERIANSLASQPKVCVVNVFDINIETKKEEKVKLLIAAGVPLVSEAINLEVQGLWTHTNWYF